MLSRTRTAPRIIYISARTEKHSHTHKHGSSQNFGDARSKIYEAPVKSCANTNNSARERVARTLDAVAYKQGVFGYVPPERERE